MSNKKIPNFNTVGTVLDRLAIEVVKQCQFADRDEKDKVALQRDMISDLGQETVNKFMELLHEKYSYYGETRTFEEARTV